MAKAKHKLHKIIVKNKSLGQVNESSIYITGKLHKLFQSKKNRAGVTYLELLKNGRAIRAFKHLLERIKSRGKGATLVLTLDKTKKEGQKYYINYQDYVDRGQGRFLKFYRDVGMDVSLGYLNTYFPKEFESPNDKVPSSQMSRVERNFPDIIESLTKKQKHKKELIKKTGQVVEDLKEEEKILRKNVDEVKELLAKSSISYYYAKLDELKRRMKKGYHETKGKDSWQKWIYDNNWIFGVQYGEPIEKEKIGFDNIPDFLFPTLDGFIDILEIKKPNHPVIKQDSSHSGSYVWSKEANEAIGQVVNYIYQMELNQYQIRERINEKYAEKIGAFFSTIRPRCFVLIGVSDNWGKKEKEGLRKLNHSLHGIDVITYSDLLKRGENLISLYTNKAKG